MIDVEKLPRSIPILLPYCTILTQIHPLVGGSGWFWLSRGSKYNIASDDYSMLEISYGILRAAMNAPKIPFGEHTLCKY